MEHFILNDNVEKDELDIVIIGTFNPVIITPIWLAYKSLIRESEANSANVRIMHNEIVDYDLEWATLNITQRRFHIKCTQVPFFEITRDLVVGIFSILKETPITSFGYNHNKTISLKTEDRFYEFGNKLCPLNNWSDSLDNARLQRVDILDKNSTQKKQGNILVTINASTDLQVNFGVVININDHYDFSLQSDGPKFSSSLILQYWDNSIEISKNILLKLSNSLKL
jgi:hypothetical protein